MANAPRCYTRPEAPHSRPTRHNPAVRNTLAPRSETLLSNHRIIHPPNPLLSTQHAPNTKEHPPQTPSSPPSLDPRTRSTRAARETNSYPQKNMHHQKHPLLLFFEVTGGNIPAEYEGHSMGLGVSLGPATIRGCPICKNNNVVVEGDYSQASCTLSAENAKFFPDFVAGIGYCVISERMKLDLEENFITGFIAHRTRVAYKAGFACEFRTRKIPSYYLLEVTGCIDIDRGRFDNSEGQLCEGCGNWKPRAGSKVGYGEKTRIPLIETWNGGDFIRQHNISTGALRCSRRLADLAAEKQWTGFGIKIMSWGCRGGGRADLRNPNWFDDLEARVHEVYPIVDGFIRSPVDELAHKNKTGVAWPFPPPVE